MDGMRADRLLFRPLESHDEADAAEAGTAAERDER
jgi:hypothetical protein